MDLVGGGDRGAIGRGTVVRIRPRLCSSPSSRGGILYERRPTGIPHGCGPWNLRAEVLGELPGSSPPYLAPRHCARTSLPRIGLEEAHGPPLGASASFRRSHVPGTPSGGRCPPPRSGESGQGEVRPPFTVRRPPSCPRRSPGRKARQATATACRAAQPLEHVCVPSRASA
jgi:hypothetical protein